MFIILYIICIMCAQVFSNYTFYQVIAFNSHERNLLHNIQLTHKKTYFLNRVTNEASTLMDVVVHSCCTKAFEKKLYKFGVEYSCIANKTLASLKDDTTDNPLQHNLLQTFLKWNDVLLWVENKVKEYSILRKTVIAKTYEHRDIFVLKVSALNTAKKMAVFIVAGEEGRDWLSSAILLNYIDGILESASSPNSLLKYYDMYFLPILNPDGFVYTKEKNRMWTKNRKLIQPPQSCTKNIAVGVNIDQNWFIEQFDSQYACNSIYPGLRALSEEETQSLSYILNSIALKLLAFINIRGFGNLITLPYSCDTDSNNLNIMMEIMKHTSDVLKMQYNKTYQVGTTASYIYNFSGNMPDWVKRKLNIPVVYTVYMQHGNFLPKESHILPLTEHLQSILNISLVISKEIYSSLYNNQRQNESVIILIVICFVCTCTDQLS